jgi:hypothetical protein
MKRAAKARASRCHSQVMKAAQARMAVVELQIEQALLPKDPNSVWAQQNPMGQGSLKGKNFLSAGALIGVNTVGQSLRNANYQLRSEPPNPQVPVSAFNIPTIEPDVNRRSLEIS